MKLTIEQNKLAEEARIQEENAVPERVSALEDSPFYDKRYTQIGVRFRGVLRGDVLEFSVRGRWVKTHCKDKQGRPKFGRKNKPITMWRGGDVEVFWR